MEENEFTRQIEEMQKQIDDLTADRDSLIDENNKLNDDLLAAKADLAETKKLNFTLARTISRQSEESDIEIMNKMFK